MKKQWRSERATVALLPAEKEALRLVARTDGMTEGDLLRGCTFDEILARARQIEAEAEASADAPA